jgi:hypothetical protein
VASIQQKGDSFYCQFFHQGHRHTFTIGRVSRDEAESKAGQVDYLLMRIKQGYLNVPAGTDIVEFVKNDGQLSAPVQKPAEALTLGQLRDRYVAVHSNGAVEENSLSTSRIHFSHLVAIPFTLS